ncbi:hypothetical protein ANCDUO_21487, partial [Ancylostoma duodenale]
SFSRHQLFNLPALYCRPREDRDHPDRKFEQFEFGDEIAESIKEVLIYDFSRNPCYRKRRIVVTRVV